MQAEKETQDQKDGEAEQMFNGVNTAGRKIANPKAKAGRFSDLHMAQFRKMDSIENHASSFRAKPGFACPTSRSLKRSGSKAGLDEPERPRTAGKATPGLAPSTFLGRPSSASPFKSIQLVSADRLEDKSPMKRQRRSGADDVSAARRDHELSQQLSAIPKPISSTLFSPTKASLSRSNTASSASPTKPSMIPRSQSTSFARTTNQTPGSRPSSSHVSRFTSKLIEAQNEARKYSPTLASKTLPPLAAEESATKATAATAKVTATPKTTLSSKLPTFAGLKSILRSTRKASATQNPERPGTPKRRNTANGPAESAKKVDFTPSVKSRYAVKLAASSPSPAKLDRKSSTRGSQRPTDLYDPAAYTIEDDGDEVWEDASSPVTYPVLPPPEPAGPVVHTFQQKAKDRNRRESKEFKSIFTTLHHPSRSVALSTLNSVKTATHSNKVMKSASNPDNPKSSPSTIRRVHTSGVTEFVQPFEDTEVQTMPHGLPGKKRRRQSLDFNEARATDDIAKENRRISIIPSVPGGWEDSILDEEDEGEKRGGKRVRTSRFGTSEEPMTSETAKLKGSRQSMSPVKKSAAREQAKKAASDRKSRGVLSMARLNALSRPKSRG